MAIATISNNILVDSEVEVSSLQPLLTNPITGTGTTNFVTKFSSSTGLVDSQIVDNGTNVLIGTTTDAGFKLDVNGTARVSGNLTIVNGSILTFGAGSSIRIGAGANVPNLPNSKMIAIGENAQVTMTTNLVGKGIAIGANSLVAGSGVAIGGDSKISGGVAITTNAIGRSGVFINSSFTNDAALPDGSRVLISSTSGNTTIANRSVSIAINGRINGVAQFAFSSFIPSTSPNTLSFGGAADNNNNDLTTVKEIYFGSGIQRYSHQNNGNQFTGVGVSYTINGSGAFGIDKNGGNVTIAGGKGTGTGTPGDVIFSTPTLITSGDTLQNLTPRWYIKGNTGQLSNVSTPDTSAIIQANSTTQGFLPPRMTGVQAEAISTPAEGLMVYSTDGSGTTITSKGWWGYDGTTWIQLN